MKSIKSKMKRLDTSRTSSPLPSLSRRKIEEMQIKDRTNNKS
jgi:hypothetical protein